MAQTNCPCCCCTCTALSAICGLCTDALQSNFLAMPWGTFCCVHLCLYCSMQCTMKSVGQQRPSIAAAAGKVQRRWDVQTYARGAQLAPAAWAPHNRSSSVPCGPCLSSGPALCTVSLSLPALKNSAADVLKRVLHVCTHVCVHSDGSIGGRKRMKGWHGKIWGRSGNRVAAVQGHSGRYNWSKQCTANVRKQSGKGANYADGPLGGKPVAASQQPAAAVHATLGRRTYLLQPTSYRLSQSALRPSTCTRPHSWHTAGPLHS